ncbi:MAG: crossover junction endodeoxyribonuclease RuvC [Parachlamydiaceae bacterium]|nr:crossover junction endodeoxyribonuclease RuvC [Parachlamydiaceae bacterium]
MIIIGIDPGTQITGYGVIKCEQGVMLPIDYGCVRPPPALKLTDRYLIIFNAIEELLAIHRPQALVVETQFVQKNVQSAIKLGMARGIIIIAAKRQGIAVFEYAPTKAKSAVVGNGRASKQQVQGMVKLLLNLDSIPTPEDAADALALAICHAQSLRFREICDLEI